MVVVRKILALLLLGALTTAAFAADPAEDLLASGHVDDAIALLQTRIRNAPKDAESYNLLCRAYFAVTQWDRGISACEKAASLAPDNSRYHMWLGRLYGEKADRVNFLSAASLAGKVRSEFETAVRLDPANVDARTDLAEFYLEAPGIVGGGRDKAEAQAKTLADLDPAKAYWVKGRLAEKSKDMAAAETNYRAAIAVSHGSANAWLNLALFYRHHQRLDQMEDALNHAVSAQMGGNTTTLMEAAEILIREGRNFPGAIQMLHRYLSGTTVEAAPAFKAHYLLGTVLEKEGDKQAAKQEYRAALSMASGFSSAQEALNRLNR